MNLTKEQVATFKQANKAYKEQLAKRWGTTVKDIRDKYYSKITFIEEEIKPSKKPKIHNVIILDTSGSMIGDKFNSAEKGVQLDIDSLKECESAEYTQTLAYFVSSAPYIHAYNAAINDIILPKNYCLVNSTPLYATIKEVLIKLKRERGSEKILVKIFTDGKNHTWSTTHKVPAAEICKLIKECQDLGMTITFVGTSIDVKHIIRRLNIDKSNTLVHDNTGEGVKKAFETSIKATRSYTKKVARGENVLTGFYKQTGEL